MGRRKIMSLTDKQREKRDRIAQWAFDTRPILSRLHLWLEDVEERWVQGRERESLSFVDTSLERAFITSVAVTALGTRLFGRYGEGKGKDKKEINRVKKDADAISARMIRERGLGSPLVYLLILVGLVLLVGAFDWLIFRNMDKLAKHLDPSRLAVTEAIFGVLLAALAVQLVVDGLAELGIVSNILGH